jgi:hypothetical protein
MQWAGDVLGQQEIPQEDLQKLTRLTGLALLRCDLADTLRQKYDISHATSDLLYPSIANLKQNYVIGLVQKFVAEVEALIDCKFEMFNLEERRTNAEEAQKIRFSTFYKKSLVFNPLNEELDIRFMESQVHDPVYQKFSEPEKLEGHIFILRAVTGAGKTATMLNAVGRNAFLLYVEASHFEAVDFKDYHDLPYVNFLKFVKQFTVNEKRNRSTQSLKLSVIVLCQGFWLCRLLLLNHMITQHKFNPTDWIFWTNDGGQRFILELQTNLLDTLAKLLEMQMDDILARMLSANISEAIQKCKELTGKDVWLGFDEAQIADKETDIPETTLLRLLLVHAVPFDIKRVIGGTRMADFATFSQSGVLKGSQIYDLGKSDVPDSYPYVAPEDALQKLEEFFNLSDIEESVKSAAKLILQGRLRYVFGFARSLTKKLKSQNKISMTEKNRIFLEALVNHSDEIQEHINARWKDIQKNLNKFKEGYVRVATWKS